MLPAAMRILTCRIARITETISPIIESIRAAAQLVQGYISMPRIEPFDRMHGYGISEKPFIMADLR